MKLTGALRLVDVASIATSLSLNEGFGFFSCLKGDLLDFSAIYLSETA
jgi:hypothetical protein